MPRHEHDNNQQSSNGIDMDAFNESIGTETAPIPQKTKSKPVTPQPSLKGEQHGIDLDALDQSIKKKEPSQTGGEKPSTTPTTTPLQSNEKDNTAEIFKTTADPFSNIPEPTPVDIAKKQTEDYQKEKDNLKNSIVEYGKQYNEQLNPDDILSSAEKSSDFLQHLKSAQTRALQESQSRLNEMKSGEMVDNRKPTPDISIFTMSDKLNDYIKSLNTHIVTQSIKEAKDNGEDKDVTISKIARRIDPYGFKKSQDFLTQSKSKGGGVFAAKGEAYNKLFSDEKGQDELLNTVKGNAEIEYNNGLQQLANNKISEGILTKNDNLINEGKADLDKVDNDVIYKYPALLKQSIAQRISREIAEESGQLKSQPDLVEGGTKEKIIGAGIDDYMRHAKEDGYLDDPKTRDVTLDLIQNHSNLFADASYLGGVGSSFISPFKSLGLSLLDLTQLRSEKDVYTDRMQDQLFPVEQSGTKSDLTVPVIGDIKVRHIANTTANLAGMAVIAIGTEGIGEELGLTATQAQRLGAYTSFGLPSYDQNLKDSYDFTDNPVTRNMYSIMGSLLNAEGGRFLDLGKLSRVPNLQKNFLKVAEGLTEKTLTEDAAKELLGKGQNAYVNAVLKYGKNVTKGAATMAYFNATNNILRLGFGDPNEKVQDIIPKAANAFMDGITGMSIMGAFGAAADVKDEKNTTYKGFLYSMSVNHDAAYDAFKIGLANGDYTKEEFNQKVAILNTAKVAKNSVDAAEAETGIKLQPEQKAVWVANKTAENFLRDRADNTENKELKSKYEKQANELNKQSKDIFDGLHFSETLEPLNDLFEAEKKYNEELDKFKSGESKDDTQLLAAKENYNDLQYKYFTENKLPSNEKEEEKKQNEEVKDTEILPTFAKINPFLSQSDENIVHPIIDKVNNAENVNENDLEGANNVLYKLLDKHPEASHLIEPLILKLQNYPDEFKTKSTTRTVTEKEPTGSSTKIKSEIKPALEQSEGSEATIKTTDGNTATGKLSIKDGNYVLDVPKGTQRIIGEKAITDNTLSLPTEQEMDNPIGFDKDGNVESITVKTKDGNLITIHDPEKALDMAIQLRADEVGEIPDAAFEQAYNEVQKEVKEEVPIKDNAAFSAETKTNNNGNKESSQKANEKSGKEGSEKSDGKKGNVEDTTSPLSKDTGAEKVPVSSSKTETNDNEQTKEDKTKETTTPPTKPPVPPVDEGKEKLPEDKPRRDKMVLRHLMDAKNIPEEFKQELDAKGIKVDTGKFNEGREVAKSVIDNYGIDKALDLARQMTFGGHINSLIYADSLDRLAKLDDDKNLTPEEKQANAIKWADVSYEYGTMANQFGKFNAAIYDFYQKSPMGMVERYKKYADKQNNDILGSKEKDIKSALKDLIDTPEFKAVVKEQVDKALSTRKPVINKQRNKAISDFFDKIKIDTKGAAGSYLVPPQIWNGAVEVMKQAAIGAASAADVIAAGVKYIQDNHKQAWDVDGMKKELTPQITDVYFPEEQPKELDEKTKEKILNRWRKKLTGLNDSDRANLLSKAMNKLVNEGALEYDDFKQLYAEAMGLPQLTDEMKNKLLGLTKTFNDLDDLGKQLDEQRESDKPIDKDLLDKYNKAKEAAILAAWEQSKIFNADPSLFDKFITDARMGTMTAITQMKILSANATAVPIRGLIHLVGTGVDAALDPFWKAEPIDNTNILLSAGSYPKEFAKNFGSGFKEMIRGVHKTNAYGNEISSAIHPLESSNKLINHYRKNGKSLRTKELMSNWHDATLGWFSEGMARVLNLSHKPFRETAESQMAEMIGKSKGYKGDKLQAFILHPDEQSMERIKDAGDRAVFQQENFVAGLINKFINGSGQPKTNSEKYIKDAKQLLAYGTQPFYKAPLNIFDFYLGLSHPSYALGKAAYSAYKGDRPSTVRNISTAVVGYGLTYALGMMASKGIFTPPYNPEKNKAAQFTLDNEKLESVNMSALMRYLHGGDPTHQNGDIQVNYKYFGVAGEMALSKADLYSELSPRAANQMTATQALWHDMGYDLQHGLEMGAMGGTFNMMRAMMGGEYDLNQWVNGLVNFPLNAIYPQTINEARKIIVGGGEPNTMDFTAPTTGKDFEDVAKRNIKDISTSQWNAIRERFGFGNDLPKKITPFGQVKPRSTQLGNSFSKENTEGWESNLYNFYRNSDAGNEQKDDELLPPPIPTKIKSNGKDYKLTPHEQEDFKKSVGQDRANLIKAANSNGLFTQDPYQIKETLKAIYHDTYEQSKIDFINRHPDRFVGTGGGVNLGGGNYSGGGATSK